MNQGRSKSVWFGLIALAVCLCGCGDKKNKGAADKPQSLLRRNIDAGKKLRTCARAPMLRWPLRGREGRDWVINNYVDVDPATAGLRDYTGAVGAVAKTHDGHDGIDIDLSSFRQMDANTPVIAAAAGEVIELDDSQPDRNTTCAGKWNYVRVRHTSGHVFTYGHLRRRSIIVKPGQPVAEGALLAAVGSSGCSTQAHLHFEVRDCNNTVVSPFAKRMWKRMHSYAPPLRVMDVMLRAGGHPGIPTLKDATADAKRARPGEFMGFGLSASGGAEGDTIGFEIMQPDGQLFHAPSRTFAKPQRHSYWFWNYSLPNKPGKWTARVLVNGRLVAEKSFELRP